MRNQRNRLLLAALIALVVLGGGMYLAPTLAGALMQQQATSPAAGSTAYAKDAAERTIEDMQARIGVDKQDYQAYGNLGLAFLQKARETNDPTFYTQAEQAFNQALALKPAITTTPSRAWARWSYRAMSSARRSNGARRPSR